MIPFLGLLFAAGGVGNAGAFKPGSGPTNTPAWITSGGQGSGDGTADMTVDIGTTTTGDLLILQVYVRNVTTAPTVSGWTLRDGPDTLGNSSHWWFTRDTRASGNESGGTVTVNSRGSSHLSMIHTFRNVAVASFSESLTAGGNASNDTTIEAPTVTATDVHRLAVAMGGCGENVASGMPSFTGESGGNWTTVADSGTEAGSNARFWVQTAALDSGGTLSGGSATISSGENWCQHGFALIGV